MANIKAKIKRNPNKIVAQTLKVGNVALTGHTGKGQIRKTYSSTTAVDFAVSVANPATTGVLNISLTNVQTNAMKAGRYVYDIEITAGSGTKTRVLEGQLEITPGVTQT